MPHTPRQSQVWSIAWQIAENRLRLPVNSHGALHDSAPIGQLVQGFCNKTSVVSNLLQLSSHVLLTLPGADKGFVLRKCASWPEVIVPPSVPPSYLKVYHKAVADKRVQKELQARSAKVPRQKALSVLDKEEARLVDAVDIADSPCAQPAARAVAFCGVPVVALTIEMLC